MERQDSFRFSRALAGGLAALFALAAFTGLLAHPARAAVPNPSSPLPLAYADDFDREDLMASSFRGGQGSSFSLLSPSRFSMQQSYSMSFMAGSGGSTSSGLYLNTLAYRLFDPLTFSLDLGFHAPIHGSGSLYGPRSPLSAGADPSLVLPRMGLEYRPSNNLLLSLEYLNGRDALKAYGPAFGSPHRFGAGSAFRSR